jgi:hypothetical protein
METVIPQQTEAGIDYRPKSYEHGTYRYSQIKQITGGDSLPAALGTVTQQSTFELPVKVFNLGKSELCWDMTSVSPAAAADTSVIWHGLGCPAIDRLSLFTRAGIFLMDIVDFNFFTQAVLPYTTSQKEILNKKRGHAGVGANAAAALSESVPVGMIEPGDSRVFGPKFAGLLAQANGQPSNQILGGNARSTGAADGDRFPQSTVEPRYKQDYTVEDTAAGAHTAALRFTLKFGDIPHAIIGMNKDLFFGETLILQVTWAIKTQIAFDATRADGDQTGAIVPGDITLNNLNLYLALETNRVVAESVMRQAQSGLKLVVPYVYTNKIQTAGQNLQSIQIRLNRGHGRSILKLYHVPSAVANVSGNYTYYHSSGFVQDLYTLMDNERLQDNVLTVGTYEHLRHMFSVTDGCCLTTLNGLNFNFVWIDDWTGAPAHEWRQTDSAECALPLDQERMWNILFTQGVVPAIWNRTFIVTQKVLTINQTSITLI